MANSQAEIKALKQMLFRQRAQTDAVQRRIDELEKAGLNTSTTVDDIASADDPGDSRRRVTRRPIVYSDDDDDDDEDEIPRYGFAGR